MTSSIFNILLICWVGACSGGDQGEEARPGVPQQEGRKGQRDGQLHAGLSRQRCMHRPVVCVDAACILLCLKCELLFKSAGSAHDGVDELHLEAHMAAKLAVMKAGRSAAGSQPATPTAGLLGSSYGRGSHVH